MKNYIRAISAFLSLIMMIPLVGCVGDPAETTASNETSAVPTETTASAETTEASEATTAAETQPEPPADEWTAVREKANGEGIKILFIGDSLTHYNEMPQIFAAVQPVQQGLYPPVRGGMDGIAPAEDAGIALGIQNFPGLLQIRFHRASPYTIS